MNNTKKQESAVDYLMNELQAAKTKEDLILSFWFYWVESVTLNDRDYQKVSANAAVNKWFINELIKEETEFRMLIAKYPTTKGRDKDWLYIKCVSKLMSRFPQALLQAAKKREIRLQKIKVAGLRIDFSIINQN